MKESKEEETKLQAEVKTAEEILYDRTNLLAKYNPRHN